MKTFEIYFADLTEEAQERLLQEFSITAPEELNWDVLPISLLSLEDAEELSTSHELWKEEQDETGTIQS